MIAALRAAVTRLAKLSPTANVGFVLLALAAGPGLTGCAGSLPANIARVEQFGSAARDIAVAAHPCLVEQFDRAEEACGEDAECVADVRRASSKLADAFDIMNSAWCAVVGGCVEPAPAPAPAAAAPVESKR